MSTPGNPDTVAPATLEIPIFPLNTVLFPDGVLPLRIFEARYMDMVRDCLKHQSRFGVCLITDGREVGQPAEHMPSGCAASIAQWDMQQLGMLNIRTLGEQRFCIESAHTQNSGLIMASVSLIQPESDQPLPPEYSQCVSLLEKIVRDLVEKEVDPMRKMIEPPFRFDSSSWVSNRLCEFLPFPAPLKYQLMMANDPIARLAAVYEFLRRQEII